jgi:hypothetical protein
MIVRDSRQATASYIMKDWDGETHVSYVRALVNRGGPTPAEYPETSEWIREFYAASDAGQFNGETLSAVRHIMAPVLSPRTMIGWAYLKPYGYSGDFEIIDRHYLNYICPDPHLANWDRYWQSSAAATAVRNRKTYFHNLLCERLQSQNSTCLNVLNLACGPARDVFEFFSETDRKIHFDCVDQDPNAITFASKLCSKFSDHVTFIQGNVVRLRSNRKYDVIWAAGLFDYFSDRLFKCVLRRLLALLNDRGELIIGNFSPGYPRIEWLRLCDWKLQHRNESELRALAAAAGAHAAQVEIGREPEGVNLFLHIKRQTTMIM